MCGSSVPHPSPLHLPQRRPWWDGMATPVASTSAQPPPPTELSLTGVTVSFLAARPKTKIKLTIKLDGKDYVSTINEGGAVQWTGKIHFRADAKIVIHTHRRNRGRLWVKFASVGAALSANPSPVIDDKKQISVALTVHEGKIDPQVLDVISATDAAKEQLARTIDVTEKLGKMWDVLQFVNTLGEALKEIHPAVGIAMAAIKSLVELCKKQKACRDEASDLVEQIVSFLSIKEHIEKLLRRAETRQVVVYVLEAITNATDYIREKTPTGLLGIIGDLLVNEPREKISSFKTKFIRAKEAFDRGIRLEILDVVDNLESDNLLNKLAPCDNAWFTSSAGCLEGTRADLCQRARNWINDTDPTQPNLFWLFGHAGSGKSTVAHTIAKMADDSAGKIGLSCFVCKRDDANRSNPRNLLPTLAYSFAQQYESYRAAIVKFLRTSRSTGITTAADVKTQFERLFEDLLVQTVDPLRPHLVVFDAIDECGSSKEQSELVTYILALSRAVPWIKVFITSRNEPAIRDIFSQATHCIACDINKEKGAGDDIQLYIKSQAAEIVPPLRPPLSDADVQQLAEQAEGLFIWCSTLFKYLSGGLGARRLLTQLLARDGQPEYDPSNPWNQLYELYDSILKSAVTRESDVAFMQTVLLIVDAVKDNRPLSVKAIMYLLRGQESYTQFTLEEAEYVVGRLHSVLYLDKSVNNAARAYHTSFYDFLRWKATTESGWMASDAVHRLMTQSCLRTLDDKLQFNICNIETAVLNKDIPDLATRISAHISEELQYSSRYWFTHVSSSALAVAEIKEAILELLRTKKLLFWFECMSLLGFLDRIRFTFRKFMRSSTEEYPTILAEVEDACRFANSFADAMDSIPHIYLSALWWLPENSLMYRNLGLSTRTSWHLIKNKPKNWDALVWRSGQIGVRSVAFSPDGRSVAYGAADGVVYIRDSQTGVLEGEPLRGHQDTVFSVAYSPDGCLIASGSSDNTVRIWDARSGKTIPGPLEHHSSTVFCVAYSPDGLFIASGSYDNTIRIWNTRTRKLEGEPLQHPDWVCGVAYSPDGRFIASACADRRVHVWDTSSRKEAVKPLQGHQSWVMSVAYSPDGCTIVSGSCDSTIRFWNAHTGQAIGEPLRGHTNFLNSVTYSPDGRFILSGSRDGTVRLWDATSHTPIGEPLQTHSGSVWCVSYSPDGSLVASASDEGVRVWDASTSFVAGSQSQDLSSQAATRAIYAVAYSPDGRFIASGSGGSDQIRIWDAQTGASVDAPVLRHAGMTQGGHVTSIAYSRDGFFIASGSANSDNSSVCVLKVQTGFVVSGPLQGHSATIWSVAYSPDGSRVVSASEDGTVRLWDVQTGAAIGEALPVCSSANSVAFSPDGGVLACGTDGGSIWIWDAHTRAPIRDPIQAHSHSVRSVAFSPDGRYIASGSDDHSVRIWDAQTGEAFGDPLQEHQDYVRCVAYLPDGRFIASGSADKTVIVWDVHSGLACGEPLRGHSNWVWSVAYSPDGHFLASGATDGKIYVRCTPNDRDDMETRWLDSCSRMDPQDGWIKDGERLLLWVPVPYRDDIRSRARIVIPTPTPYITAYSGFDRQTVLKYSGQNWTNIVSGFDT